MPTPYHQRSADKARLLAGEAQRLIDEHAAKLARRRGPQPMAQPQASTAPPDELAAISAELVRRLNARRS